MANSKWQIANGKSQVAPAASSLRSKTAGGDKRFAILGLIAGGLLSIFGKSPHKPTTDDLKQAEFKTSTQRLGIRFTERIRKVFRFRWLRKS